MHPHLRANDASTALSPSTILVTGATGFVGGELLKRLIRRNATIVCPVRADSATAAAERGAARIVDLVGEAEAARVQHRIEWIRSDLEEARLGWDSDTWRRVAQCTSEIYHCAASVSFDLPLDEAHRINVDGTVHIHELAETAQIIHGQFRRFHHVSTAYVSGTVSGRVDAHHLPNDRAGNFRNTYERTKARAERYLRERASAGGLDVAPVSIYRPSIVGGDSVTGQTDNWNVLYVPLKMTARGMLPAFPIGGRAIIDSIGVDYVVDGMLALGEHSTEPLEAFHLVAGPGAFDMVEMFSTMTTTATEHPDFKPSNTKLLGPGRWTGLTTAMKLAARAPKSWGNLQRTGVQAQRGLDGCSVYVPYTRVDTIFENAREVAILRTDGVAMPPAAEYLQTIIDYALDTNFGKRPVAHQQPCTEVDISERVAA